MHQDTVDIVIADDNAFLLSVLSEILTESGYSVRTAMDGLGALTEIRNHEPDILLSDLHMPRMSGLELMPIVRRHCPRIKIIAMSASYSGTIVPQGLDADAFYGKDGAGVARLLRILNTILDPTLDPILDAPELRSSRLSTPLSTPSVVHRFSGPTNLLLNLSDLRHDMKFA